MKKSLAIVLSLLIILGCTPLSFAADDGLSVIFATDIHFSLKDSSSPITNSTQEEPFGHTVSNGKLTAESNAILDEFFKQAAESKSEYVILTGDISDNGEAGNVAAVVEKLEAFEKSSGKTVIACMGNHETYHTVGTNSYVANGLSGAEFREYYKNLGYDKALDIDAESASYTVDLNGKYRLICVDCNGLSERLVNWISQQAEKAKNDGKYLISVTHFSLFSHYKIQKIAHDSVIDSSYGLADKYIDWGIKFNFSGHTHELDTAEYTNDKGVVYDIACGALTTYPANYKTAVFEDSKVRTGTKYIENIDMSLVPEGLAQEAKELLQNDFRAYAKKMFVIGTEKQVAPFITPSQLINLAKLDPGKDGDIIDIINAVVPRVNDAIRMPLYGQNSLSSIADKNGFPLPECDYPSLFKAFCEAYCLHCAGNESCSLYTPLGKLLQNGLAAALTYALDILSEEDFQKVINWALDSFELPVNIPTQLRNLAANAMYKYDGIEYIVVYIASPLIEDFLNDSAPNDVTATFPGYQENEVKSVTFWEKVRSFFSSIVLFLNSLFAFLHI